jgi:MFS family permease
VLFHKSFSHNEKLSLSETFFSSLVVGLAETYFIAYALHLGVSVIQSGLLSSLPLLFAGISPFLLRHVLQRFSNSTWVLVACGLQAFAVALLALIGAFSSHMDPGISFYALLGLFTLYWFGNFAQLPSWNKWISEIVPHERSDRFFSARTRMIQLGSIIGLLIGGFALHLKNWDISTTLLFILLFLMAYHFKMAAFYFFYRLPKAHTRFNLSWTRSRHFFKGHRGFFIAYLIYNTSLYISSPYVSGYLLSIRELKYEQFMWVMAAFFSGKFITTIILDRLKLNLTPHKLYFWGALLASPLPAFWPVCQNVFQLSLLHFVSGWGWAAWDVGISLAIFKNIQPDEKVTAVSMYNLIGLPTQVLGTVIGALLLQHVYQNSYGLLFVTAGVARLMLVLPLYFKKFGER